MTATFRRHVLLGVLGLFILFLYGPTLTILVLSFQGPDGGLTFPMNGVSLHWFGRLFQTQAVGDFGGSLTRAFMLATWTLPFGLLIMFAVFNRFNRAWEEAARDLGATPWQSFRHVVLPIILPSVIGIALFGFTLSYDKFARTLLTAGSDNTLPLEIFGMTTSVTTPVLYALGTLTTGFSFVVILVSLAIVRLLAAKRGA
jgi:putative spermidine/putrescine transport system permease protein